MIPNLQSHYGFTRMPFTASVPVPALFSSAACKEAVTRLRWLISARGPGVLTGEAGAGKTASLRAAVDGLDASRHALIYLPNPQVGVRGLAACTENKTIVDEKAARTAIAEEISDATD
jgi:type II secretory pathway predicted ATPase ExeA